MIIVFSEVINITKKLAQLRQLPFTIRFWTGCVENAGPIISECKKVENAGLENAWKMQDQFAQ